MPVNLMRRHQNSKRFVHDEELELKFFDALVLGLESVVIVSLTLNKRLINPFAFARACVFLPFTIKNKI